MTRDARSSAQSATTRGADPNGILASIGLVAYDWRIDTDTLTWGANAAEVLQVRDVTRIGTGRGYAALIIAAMRLVSGEHPSVPRAKSASPRPRKWD